MHNLSSYCGLIGSRMSASDTDLPASRILYCNAKKESSQCRQTEDAKPTWPQTVEFCDYWFGQGWHCTKFKKTGCSVISPSFFLTQWNKPIRSSGALCEVSITFLFKITFNRLPKNFFHFLNEETAAFFNLVVIILQGFN